MITFLEAAGPSALIVIAWVASRLLTPARWPRREVPAPAPVREEPPPPVPAVPPVIITTDDLPASTPAFRPDELDLLAYLGRATDDALNGDGDVIADTLRRRFPDSADSNLSRVVMALIWITADIWRSSSCDPVDAWGSLEDGLGAAALHLAALETGAML